MLPSEVLSMTLPMLEMLTIQGTQNAKTIVKISDNLTVLHKALKRIEAEASGETQKKEEDKHDADNGQEQNV